MYQNRHGLVPGNLVPGGLARDLFQPIGVGGGGGGGADTSDTSDVKPLYIVCWFIICDLCPKGTVFMRSALLLPAFKLGSTNILKYFFSEIFFSRKPNKHR